MEADRRQAAKAGAIAPPLCGSADMTAARLTMDDCSRMATDPGRYGNQHGDVIRDGTDTYWVAGEASTAAYASGRR